jgi:hypothetical protein
MDITKQVSAYLPPLPPATPIHTHARRNKPRTSTPNVGMVCQACYLCASSYHLRFGCFWQLFPGSSSRTTLHPPMKDGLQNTLPSTLETLRRPPWSHGRLREYLTRTAVHFTCLRSTIISRLVVASLPCLHSQCTDTLAVDQLIDNARHAMVLCVRARLQLVRVKYFRSQQVREFNDAVRITPYPHVPSHPELIWHTDS